MENPWRQRWQEGRIGFHLEETHPALVKHWPELGVADGTKVLVPLCGKSLDMRWLADRGHPVLGIELAPEAIEQFWLSDAAVFRAIPKRGSRCLGRAVSSCGAVTFFICIFSKRQKWARSTTGPL